MGKIGKKQIMILDGTGRNDERASALIQAFTDGAEQAGNKVTWFELQDIVIYGCRSCQGCA